MSIADNTAIANHVRAARTEIEVAAESNNIDAIKGCLARAEIALANVHKITMRVAREQLAGLIDD